MVAKLTNHLKMSEILQQANTIPAQPASPEATSAGGVTSAQAKTALLLLAAVGFISGGCMDYNGPRDGGDAGYSAHGEGDDAPNLRRDYEFVNDPSMGSPMFWSDASQFQGLFLGDEIGSITVEGISNVVDGEVVPLDPGSVEMTVEAGDETYESPSEHDYTFEGGAYWAAVDFPYNPDNAILDLAVWQDSEWQDLLAIETFQVACDDGNCTTEWVGSFPNGLPE